MNYHHMIHRIINSAGLLAIMLLLFSADHAMAQSVPSELLDECTQSDFFDYDNNPVNQAQDMLQTVVDEIVGAIDTASEDLYNAFVNNPEYLNIINAAFMLVVTFFAVSFMFGFVTLTLLQGLIRLLKIGLIIWIATPGAGFDFINDFFVTFFNEGSAWLINAMVNIATTGEVGEPATDVAQPFMVLDVIIQVVFSPRMFVTIIGTFATGPFGVLMAGALIWSVFSLFMAVLKALQVYVMALVIKAILIGLAPVFLPMMLFDRTKQMFTGWLNQLVNFSLQPILLFAFLAFFATLVESSARDMIPKDDVHLCYVKADTQAATPFDSNNWKYMCPQDDGTLAPYEGKWTWEGPVDCPNAPAFPMNHVNVLVFLLLTHIMKQLCDVSIQIAAEISSGMLSLDRIPNAINQWFGGGQQGGGNSQLDINRTARL